MNRLSFWRWLVGWMAAVFIAVTPGHALLRFNDNHAQVYVTGTVAVGWNSNIFSNQVASADTTYNASLNVEYRRKAGYIGINAAIGWDFGRFQKFTAENFANPHASLEFSKGTGRTTWDLLFNAARQSSTDSAANVRAQSISYGADFNWKYPDFLDQRHTLSGGFGWSQLNYQNNTALINLATYTASLDLFYIYTDERDLFGGYRVRVSDTSVNSRDVDHNFSLGISGRIIPKLNGSLRVGYQVRQSDANGLTPASTFTGISIASNVRYDLNKKTTVNGQVGKDFSTTSTNISTDSLTANLNVTYAHNAKFSVFGNLGGGINKFLGVTGAGRRDFDLTWGAGLISNPHLGITSIGENLSLITAGGRSKSPTQFLESTAFAQLIERLKKHYDLIVIDSPPMGAVTDALLIANRADEILYVCRFNRAYRKHIRLYIKALRQGKNEVLGIALNGLSPRRIEYYSNYRYYRSYKKYYGTES